MTFRLENVVVRMAGAVTPPADMLAAARASLSASGFSRLMRKTDGRVPTSRELAEVADAEREHAAHIAALGH